MAKRLPREFSVNVTTADIALGLPCWPDACPIAIALQRYSGRDSRQVRVFTNEARVGRARLRHDGAAFVDRFDMSGRGRPTTVHFVRIGA